MISDDARSMILDSLTAGCSLADALRGAGVTRKAFAEACAADRDYERACDAAMAEGRRAAQALRVEGVGGLENVVRGAGGLRIQEAPHEPAVAAHRDGRSGLVDGDVRRGGGGEAKHEGGEHVHAPQRAPAATAAQEAWAAAARASAAREAEPASGAALDPSDRWDKARSEAAAVAPGHLGTLLWIDARCQRAGMHALDPWWTATLADFYASGKLCLTARVGLRGAKSVTVCRSLVNDALFTVRDLDPSTAGVIPIMSADRTEATDRFWTIRKVLGACGVASSKGDDAGDLLPGGLGTEYTASTLPSGGGVIKTVDSQGHAIEFRIYPARITGAIGYTAVAGFCDEVDLWPVDLGVSAEEVARRSDKGKANPADVVLDRLLERFTTTMASAHLYVVSASYHGQDSAHARKVKDGDTAIQMVARLGALGAERDNAARRRLAEMIGSTDPRLLLPADPLSTDIPAWATNPAAPIETCYALSRSRVGPMLGRYGGRPDESEGAGPLSGIEWVRHGGVSAATVVDAMVGVVPPEDGGRMWGRVVVGIDRDGVLRVLDDDSGDSAVFPAERIANLSGMRGASVLACPARLAPLLTAELAAAYAGGTMPTAPVAAVDIHDGPALRLGPLRTLYQRERITHAPGLDALEAEARSALPEGPRCPRVEALAAAVARLVACYPHLGAGGDAEPIRGPKPSGAVGVGRTEDDAWLDHDG